MTELLTAAQMRAIEEAQVTSGAVTGLELMERAGRGVVAAIFGEWPNLAPADWDAEEWGRGASPSSSSGRSDQWRDDGRPPKSFEQDNGAVVRRAVVLCGPGNNGGDGFVIARLLQSLGWDVRVFLFGKAEKMPPDARANYDRWAAENPVGVLDGDIYDAAAQPDLVVDAVFGIGVNRPLPPEVARALSYDLRRETFRWAFKTKLVAVDIPSGLCSDRGLPIIDAGSRDAPSDADLTVTFHTPKLGHYLGGGPKLSGKLAVMDIGLRGDAMELSMSGLMPDAERVRLFEPIHTVASATFRRPMPLRIFAGDHLSKARGQGDHKYDHGSVLVFGGGVGKGGAARLAARAALRVGAGLVTISVPPAALQENACQLNAIMLRSDRDAASFAASADDRVTGYCIGPGMGVGDRTRAFVLSVLAMGTSDRHWRRPAVVLDADALTSFADAPDELFAATHERCVLTPHAGEFARLFPKIADDWRNGEVSKVDATRKAADRAGCIILLKGPDTVIASPGGPCSVHASVYDRAAPWLATAGAGDVLAGLIAGLGASQLTPELFCCVEVATWLHTECALSFGPGLIAEDLPEELPNLLRTLAD